MSNSCGSGTSTGSATVTVAPFIGLGSLSSANCTGTNFSVPFQANFTPNNNFRVELSDAVGNFNNPISIGTGTISPITAQIPNTITSGTGYKIRIVSDNPTAISAASSALTINQGATATISGTTTINEGQSANLTINFTGQGPWTYSITGSSSQTTSSNPVSITVLPTITTTYNVTSISNSVCGTGSAIGSATITVNPIPVRLISCFPFNGNANDGKGLNNGTNYGASLTTDRFENANSAYYFNGVSSKIQISNSQILNEEYTYTMWFNANNFNNYMYLFSLESGSGGIGLMFYGTDLRAFNGSAHISHPMYNFTAGQWYHVAVTRTFSNLNIYVNGVRVNTLGLTYNSIFGPQSNFNAYIGGKHNTNSEIFNGKIDDFQIYKGALTSEQIQVLYNSNDGCFDTSTIKVLSLQSLSSNALCKGQNVNIPFGSANTTNPIKVQLSDANGNFSFPIEIGSGNTSPITAQIPTNQPLGTNYKIRLVSSDSSPIISNVISNISVNASVTATITGDATINEGEATNLIINFTGSAPYTYTITGGTSQTTSSSPLSISVSPLVNTSYSITSLSNTCGNGTGSGTATITVNPVPIRLVSCFPFNGNANDSKGLNNGTVIGATLTTDRFGNVNSAYNFNSNGYIEVNPANGILNLEFSISVNFNSSTSQALNSYFTILNLSTNTFVLKRAGNGSFALQFTGMSNFGLDFYEFPLPNYTAGVWHSLVFIHSFSKIYVFIDNQLIGNVIPNVGYEEANYGYPRRIIIGSLENNFNNFQGKIDDVQIYKGALTAGQVQALYNNSNSCFDASTYTCLSNMTYNSILNGQQTLQVSNQIIGSSTIQTGSNIHFDSKNSVILQPGFKTETNTVFRASAGGGCN